MNYHNITQDDMLNGDGLRTVLWVAGCTHHCPECQNPETWDIAGGLEFDDKAKQELFADLSKPYTTGITFSGGDPLHPFNRNEVLDLAQEISEKFPSKTIWLYTGFLWEEIKDLDKIKYIDVLIDGEFKKELNDNTLFWVGSSNQRIIDVKKSLQNNSVEIYLEQKQK